MAIELTVPCRNILDFILGNCRDLDQIRDVFNTLNIWGQGATDRDYNNAFSSIG